MKKADKREVEIKAQHKGMFLKFWADNDPTQPEKASYWLLDEATDLPHILDPASLEEIDQLLSNLPDKKTDPRPDPQFGDGTEA